MQKKTFKNIGIVGRLGSQLVSETVQRLVEHLTSTGYNVILEDQLEGMLTQSSLQFSTVSKLGESCDLVVVVGGDGCMLGAARDLARGGIPVVGVNRGNLGFLTDIWPSKVEDGIDAILAGEYTRQSRFLLDAEIKREGATIAEGLALNDIVVHPGQAVQMIEFDLFIDGEFVYSQKSDGLIVATPTGSTAYALSAGGPIMHPALDALAIVPMFPHMLTSRPIVVSAASEIKIKLRKNRNHVSPQISFDGQPSAQARADDTVYIRKLPQKLNLIHPMGHDFYETCRSKLGWNRRLGGMDRNSGRVTDDDENSGDHDAIS